MMVATEEVDPYAWAKERQAETTSPQPAVAQQPVTADTAPVAATPAVSGYPGWKWDADQNKWVPDDQ